MDGLPVNRFSGTVLEQVNVPVFEAFWRSPQLSPLAAHSNSSSRPPSERCGTAVPATQNGSMTRHAGWLTRALFIEPFVPRSASSPLRTQVRPEAPAAAAGHFACASFARPFGTAVRRSGRSRPATSFSRERLPFRLEPWLAPQPLSERLLHQSCCSDRVGFHEACAFDRAAPWFVRQSLHESV